ncbi:MAG: hypothetical protein K1060chlam5_01256 [Candidatus Anoxychlamydiales bacterium]|nr:hypothetical protein [Candidatus Anoxychlamydiales bacterium]
MKNSHEFINKREAILDNLQTLKSTLLESIDLGYEDIEDELYNKIQEMLDITKEIDNMEELYAIVLQGKNIESNLDTYLSSKGISNLEILWTEV